MKKIYPIIYIVSIVLWTILLVACVITGMNNGSLNLVKSIVIFVLYVLLAPGLARELAKGVCDDILKYYIHQNDDEEL